MTHAGTAEWLRTWAESCVVSALASRTWGTHTANICTYKVSKRIASILNAINTLGQTKCWQWAQYCACYGCGVPQEFYSHWVARKDGVGAGSHVRAV